MDSKSNRYLVAAILLAVLLHGGTMFYTLESTYDALIHLFFAEHYTAHWFEPWNEKWYTGFSVMSYPPLVHQWMALIALGLGLKTALYLTAILAAVLFVTGVYRFALLICGNKTSAGYAALLAAFSSAFIEALHIFGQLPTLIGISLLLHALPFVYNWVRGGQKKQLACALAVIGVTVCSHHVTPIFGMVFFIFPTIGLALLDLSANKKDGLSEVRFSDFFQSFRSSFWRIVSFGMLSLVFIVGCILPYWINSKNNPITQIPIPHGSRDNFLEITSSGLVFFIVPWGLFLFLLPYLFVRFFSKRLLFFGISFGLLFLLGTGGTTPIPEMILGETAFNILTLDRFTFWAAVMAIPIVGDFFHRFVEGDIADYVRNKFGTSYHRITAGIFSVLLLFTSIGTLTMGKFRPSQPAKIKTLPIVNFLNQDDHDRWRYLTLGFGDQMAWLGTQTKALTVDGNYHSARRLPELTTRAVERLENSKFRGIEGIGSLQQFLTVPEKYNLKYIFSNDKFYDPLLYFCGWQRLSRLENGILVWEKLNVPPLPVALPRDSIPKWQKWHWGVVPMSMLALCIITLLLFRASTRSINAPLKEIPSAPERLTRATHYWAIGMGLLTLISFLSFISGSRFQSEPQQLIETYYDALDFKDYEKAHSCLDPDAGVDFDLYMLQVSVSDGLLSSYAKLDSISIEMIDQSPQRAKARVHTTYITPLKRISNSMDWDAIRRGQKWYLIPKKSNPDLPPRKLISRSEPDFHLHGRRKITTEATSYEDVLRQPKISLLTSSLVKRDSAFHLVGRIRNDDYVPADVVVEGFVYDTEKELIAKYSAKDVLKHKLMPNEETGFRIDFEELAWVDNNSNAPATFDPQEFAALAMDLPTEYSIHLSGNVTAQDLNKSLTVVRSVVNDSLLLGTLFNAGTDEITVPQILLSYYDETGLVWVESHYLDTSVRQQRKLDFKIPLSLGKVRRISEATSTWSINGRIGDGVFQSHEPGHFLELKDPLNISIDLNSYIANP